MNELNNVVINATRQGNRSLQTSPQDKTAPSQAPASRGPARTRPRDAWVPGAPGVRRYARKTAPSTRSAPLPVRRLRESTRASKRKEVRGYPGHNFSPNAHTPPGAGALRGVECGHRPRPAWSAARCQARRRRAARPATPRSARAPGAGTMLYCRLPMSPLKPVPVVPSLSDM